MKARLILIGGILGLLGVAAGTFHAHGLDSLLPESITQNHTQLTERHDWFETGVRYHMFHALAVMALAALPVQHTGRVILAAMLFLAGVIIFSGSLYILALTGIRSIGMITPIGGAAFLAGWLCVIISAKSADPHTN